MLIVRRWLWCENDGGASGNGVRGSGIDRRKRRGHSGRIGGRSETKRENGREWSGSGRENAKMSQWWEKGELLEG
jgi:hypothetical protein